MPVLLHFTIKILKLAAGVVRADSVPQDGISVANKVLQDNTEPDSLNLIDKFKDVRHQLLLRISGAHAIHWSRACHVIFKRAHRVENSTKYRAHELCVNFVCEYFCWMFDDPHFFFGRSLSFLILSIILKKHKNLYVRSFKYF